MTNLKRLRRVLRRLCDMEEKGIVARGCLPPGPRCRGNTAEATLPRRCPEAVVPRHRAAGLRQERTTGNNPFLLHVAVHVLQGDKGKVPFPQFLLTMAELTPTTSLVVEIPETSDNTTQSSLFTKCKHASFTQACISVACYVP